MHALAPLTATHQRLHVPNAWPMPQHTAWQCLDLLSGLAKSTRRHRLDPARWEAALGPGRLLRCCTLPSSRAREL